MSYFKSKKIVRKCISLSLCVLCICLSLTFSLLNVSAEDKVFGDFKYTEGTEGVYITEYTGDGTQVVIPDTIEGKTVRGIESEAFWYKTEIESVEFPDTVIALGARAFQGCKSLVSVKLPEEIMNIEDACFAQCTSLENIEIPESLYYLGSGVFDDTPYIGKFGGDSVILGGRIFYLYRGNSEYVEIPQGVTCISASAFLECESIKRVVIPESVEIIGGYAFYGCDNLKSIKIPRNVAEVGPYAFGCYSEPGNPEPQVMKDFVIYSAGTDSEGNESLGSAYAKEYGLALKGEAEEPYYMPAASDNDEGVSSNTVMIIVIVSIFVIVVIGGMLWGYFSDKKAKEENRKRRENKNKKKNKR